MNLFASLVLALTVVQGAPDSGQQLRAAIFAGDLPTVTRLAKVKATANAADGNGVAPLMIASALGRADMARLLLDGGAEIDAKTTKLEATALMFATDFGRLQVATLLLERGANLKATDSSGNSAIDYAVSPRTGDTETDKEREIQVGQFLKSKGAELKLTQDNFLGRVLATGDVDALAQLLDSARGRRPQ